jgi:hypothetical protein
MSRTSVPPTFRHSLQKTANDQTEARLVSYLNYNFPSSLSLSDQKSKDRLIDHHDTLTIRQTMAPALKTIERDLFVMHLSSIVTRL